MSYREPEHDDLLMRVGVGLRCTEEEIKEMAESFADEFARMGYVREQILALFRNPDKTGAHLAWETLGEEKISRIIVESVEFWSHYRRVVKDAAD